MPLSYSLSVAPAVSHHASLDPPPRPRDSKQPNPHQSANLKSSLSSVQTSPSLSCDGLNRSASSINERCVRSETVIQDTSEPLIFSTGSCPEYLVTSTVSGDVVLWKMLSNIEVAVRFVECKAFHVYTLL